MSWELYLVFVVATALLIATPGPNVALIVGTSLTHGLRTGLIVESGEPREVHHVACLLGYGAGAVNPYLMFESLSA